MRHKCRFDCPDCVHVPKLDTAMTADQAIARVRSWLALDAPELAVSELSAGLEGLNRFVSLCGMEAAVIPESGRPALRVWEIE